MIYDRQSGAKASLTQERRVAPSRLTPNRLLEFVRTLTDLGGGAGNGRLREQLGWEEELYWRAQGQLIEEGKIVPGPGRGGTVRLAKDPDPQLSPDHIEVQKSASAEPTEPLSERDLYGPIREAILTKWINRFGFDEVRVEETHSQGSRDTGGTFTRPDLTAAAIRRYVYLPKTLEIITFEIKAAYSVSIMGVLEAIAHREAANRSYVIFPVSRSEFETAAESDRIIQLAQKYGIGILLTEKPSDVESWEVPLDAIRHDPDPARLDRFLGDLPSDPLRKQLSKWKE